MSDPTWKEVPFANGYDVSTAGGVRSRRKWGGHVVGVEVEPRELSTKTDKDGYAIVTLSIGYQCRPKQFRVHRLVALTFLGQPPTPQHEVRHLDGNPSNNALTNIAWGTRKQNGEDKVRHGRSLRGRRNRSAKLTKEKVESIRADLANGLKQQTIAAKHGMAQSSISNIANSKTWKEG